jgi:hypothetical protein
MTDFWSQAFGGKSNLRLMLEARDFRLRKNKKSMTTASFNYADGRIVINILHLKDHDYYTVCRYDKDRKTRAGLEDWLTTPSIEWVSECVEDLTGKVLSF